MKIGITGSTGTLGSYLSNKFKKIKKFKGKIENKKNVDDWIIKNDLDAVIHLAAMVPVKKVNRNKKKALIVNLDGTKNIIDSLNKYSNKKVWFFYSSTSHVYSYGYKIKNESSDSIPLNYYGKTKKLAENYIIKNQKKIIPCIGRIFSYTHYNQDKNFLVPSLIDKLKNKKKDIYFKNLNHYRDFITIYDIYTAIKKLMSKKTKGIYNISSGQKLNLKDILLTLNRKYKKNIYFNDNKIKTVLFGSNNKLKKIGWKPSYKNYLKYIFKVYL